MRASPRSFFSLENESNFLLSDFLLLRVSVEETHRDNKKVFQREVHGHRKQGDMRMHDGPDTKQHQRIAGGKLSGAALQMT